MPIKELVWSGEIKMEMLQVMINSRHQDALKRARAATELTIEALRADKSLELVALDLRIAVNAVGEIVGKTTTEDLSGFHFQPVLHWQVGASRSLFGFAQPVLNETLVPRDGTNKDFE